MEMKRLVAPILFCTILLGAGPSYAQGGPETLQFSFSNPGARSIGLGGAFVALADDATAIYSNPGGLVQLARPEISIDGRFWSYATPFTEGGQVLGDTRDLRSGVSRDAIPGISFLSFVYPKDDWSFAVYRHQSASFESRTETQGFFTPRSRDRSALVHNFDRGRELAWPRLPSSGHLAIRHPECRHGVPNLAPDPCLELSVPPTLSLASLSPR